MHIQFLNVLGDFRVSRSRDCPNLRIKLCWCCEWPSTVPILFFLAYLLKKIEIYKDYSVLLWPSVTSELWQILTEVNMFPAFLI